MSRLSPGTLAFKHVLSFPLWRLVTFHWLVDSHMTTSASTAIIIQPECDWLFEQHGCVMGSSGILALGNRLYRVYHLSSLPALRCASGFSHGTHAYYSLKFYLINSVTSHRNWRQSSWRVWRIFSELEAKFRCKRMMLLRSDFSFLHPSSNKCDSYLLHRIYWGFAVVFLAFSPIALCWRKINLSHSKRYKASSEETKPLLMD